MRISILLFAFSLFFFLPDICTAQSQELKFNLITGTNGISLGKINSITQDKYGFMWFADQSNRCIIRYDGSAMTRYQYDPKNPNSMGGYYPECLYTDSTGIIWIGFFGQGLDKFDPETNTYTHYDHDPSVQESLGNNDVTAIQIDRLGNIWVGTNSGLDLLNQETGKFIHFRHNENDPTSLSDNVVRAIYEDHEGTLWVGTGFAYDFDNTGGLNRFDRETGTFTSYLHDPENPQSLIDNKIRSIFEDSKGNFWVGTRGDGLHSMDRKTGLFERHTYDPAKPDKLSSPPVSARVSHVTFITEDAAENLWIGSNTNGMNRYDPETKKVTHFDNTDDHDLSSWCAYPSREGFVWVGTQQSTLLYRIDLYNDSIPFFSTNSLIQSFYEEPPAVLWMATYGGLTRIDRDSRTIRHFRHDPQDPNSLSNNNVKKIIKDKQGIFWICTAFGLNRFNPTKGIFTHYLNDPNDSTSLGFNDISDIIETSDSNLWIGTFGGGLDMFDRKTEKFTHYRNDLAFTTSISSNFVSVIFEENKDNLWVGSFGNFGLNRLDRETGDFNHYITGLFIFDIYRDSYGVLWVGTENGLYRYDRESDKFSPYIGKNNNLSINATVLSIIGDDENNLWIGSAIGIFRLNQERNNLILYGKENGVNGTMINRRSVYKQLDGKILVGTGRGYFGFYPDKLKTISGTSKLYFTNLWLNDKPINPGNNGPLVEPIIKAKEVQLGYDQNVFAISAASIDYRASEDKKIYYTLENYDQGWRVANVGEKANYFKVPPGDYTFRIKSANSSNGIWSEKSIAVTILPPWWLSWWAYTIYGILFVAGIFLADKIQSKRLLEKERARTQQKELEQAKKIKQAYDQLEIAHTNLKATQSQLIHSEKMASLGELTAGIAHEIQNPLNFVNNFSEVSEELIDELKAERGKLKGERDESLEEEILNDITQNLEKINHHGQRASGIVKGMLQHSRGTSDTKELTDINALADEYLRLAYHGLRAKDKSFNADFKLDLDESLPKINVVPQDIGRVLLNLINNAFHAVREVEKPVVSVKTETSPLGQGGSRGVRITVSDNGQGIPEQVREKIFEPFFTTKPAGEGTGLGLSMTYDIITKGHGGTIEVESREGIGTEFLIKLPF